jgi:hypothetical protein
MDKARAPAKERQKWDKLVAAMFDYESRHKDILLESVSQLGTRLAQLPVTGIAQPWSIRAGRQGRRCWANPGAVRHPQPDRSGAQAGGRLAQGWLITCTGPWTLMET